MKTRNTLTSRNRNSYKNTVPGPGSTKKHSLEGRTGLQAFVKNPRSYLVTLLENAQPRPEPLPEVISGWAKQRSGDGFFVQQCTED